MHYFIIYKSFKSYFLQELLFQMSNASYFVFPFIDWQLSCLHVERNRE